jgi:transcriptional regulator with XRE-family HTH domain
MDNLKTRKEVGRRIKIARQKTDLTQVEVAEKAGIHVSYYSRIERGEENPSIEILENIAKALKVKSADILPF